MTLQVSDNAITTVGVRIFMSQGDRFSAHSVSAFLSVFRALSKYMSKLLLLTNKSTVYNYFIHFLGISFIAEHVQLAGISFTYV